MAIPDTADLTHVTALAHKGAELGRKGQNVRSAEKFRLAAEEAEKALPVPDCLVACALRNEQLEALMRHAAWPTVPLADADDALREACLRLLPSVMGVLERRKAAGTLLPGSCRATEEKYKNAAVRRNLELQGFSQAVAVRQAALLAPFVGVGLYVCAAASVAYIIFDMDALQSAFVLSDEQRHAAFMFLASAVDLMAQPRDYDRWLAGEPDLVRYLRKIIPAVSGMAEPATRMLCNAWQRVLQSGVLCARGIDEAIEMMHQGEVRLRASVAEDLAAGRLQHCALADCAARESHVSQFKRCGACRAVCYCSREHQVEDWPSHKAACKAARKET